MRIRRYIGFACVIWSMWISNPAHSAAVPAFNGKANNAVGSIIQSKLGKWGFAANDPRISATAAGVGSAATTIAVGIATGTVATVGWPALLVAAGVTAVVGGAISLATDLGMKWLFNSDGTVTAQVPAGTITPSQGTQAGDTYFWGSTFNGKLVTGGTIQDVLRAIAMYSDCGQYSCSYAGLTWVDTPVTYTTSSSMPSGSTCTVKHTYTGGGYFTNGSNTWPRSATGYGAACVPAGQSTPDYNAAPPAAPTPTPKPLAEAIADLPDSETAKPASDELLAAAANVLWKNMTPGQSNGVPWSASDPITPADVAQWRSANPSVVPTVGDMIAPIASPSTTTVPMSYPIPTYNNGPSPTTGTGQEINWGDDPNVGAPVLAPTPTAQTILNPLLNLMPDLRSFVVPSHTGTCPKPSFNALGNMYVFESQCDLIESHRAIIEAAMLLVWTITSVLIVLRA